MLPRKPQHMFALEYILNQAIVLAHAKMAIVIGHNAGRVLPAMLKNDQRIVNRLIYGAVTDYPNNSAHCQTLFIPKRIECLNQASFSDGCLPLSSGAGSSPGSRSSSNSKPSSAAC